jgi:acyl-CoA synthetase (AMP-forming)/AMP-acid ligase II
VVEPRVAAHEVLRLPESIQTIPEALAFWAELTPDAPALRAIDGRSWSHRALLSAVGGVSSRLAAMGVEGSARVALLMPPGVESCMVLLGAMTGAVAAPLNMISTPRELTRDLERLGVRLVVTGGAAAPAARNVAASLGIPAMAADELLATDDPRALRPVALPDRHPDDIAVILHTSGTTADPKRVPRPHRTYVAAARASQACTNLSPADVELLWASLHSNQGVGNLLAALFSGGLCVAAPGFDPAAIAGWLVTHRPTWFVSAPTEMTLLVDAVEAANREAAVGPDTRLRAVRLGAQPLPPGLVERAERILGALIFDGYGMTEASYITGQGPGPEDRRPGTVGPPLNSEIRVLDADGGEAPPGAVGQIVIRGETLFPGYLDDPAANAAAFLPGGWFRTGDLGSLDERGNVLLTGRANEQINRGGEKIAPAEIDHALLAHPAVAEAAAFAVPDTRLGEDIVAAVVLRGGMNASARELRVWLLARLSPTKVPRRIWLVDALPRTVTGKVRRGVLTQRWRDQLG